MDSKTAITVAGVVLAGALGVGGVSLLPTSMAPKLCVTRPAKCSLDGCLQRVDADHMRGPKVGEVFPVEQAVGSECLPVECSK